MAPEEFWDAAVSERPNAFAGSALAFRPAAGFWSRHERRTAPMKPQSAEETVSTSLEVVERRPSREECLRAAAKILLAAAIRIERERLERELRESSPQESSDSRPPAGLRTPSTRTNEIPAAFEAVRLYSVASVADHLQVSRGWVYERISRGELRKVELGDMTAKTRIRADDLQRFVDDRTFPKEEHDG
ncbi:helix-turn-helix domain-containing protein [Planctomonas sp. JC2975]|uniref:helix-turn-helix domain-containing protein n=1 Tax=Planctomonas sp. JC2975 TaxID=2729626 RepID=UPI0014754362|nr:helix-turn-helix domain-containing protein [Planctomonas sp. JC2975]NNC10680.1 helix-turn-helix domain-containing protein [Planctomonas sp. JC2975]